MKNPTFDKIAIIGTGNVGATIAYTLMSESIVQEIVLVDANTEKAEGEAMDLNHGISFVKPSIIISGGYNLVEGCDIIIITAGASQKPGETRLQLMERNTAIFKQIIDSIKQYNNDCILLVVTNPVDALTYVAYKLSGFPKERVIGSGTVLDTGRLRYMIGNHTGIDTRNVHSYIIGEHGDSELACWSSANIAGIPFNEYCKKCHVSKLEHRRDCNECKEEIFNDVKNAAYHIIEKKGATYYAVALAVRRIVEAITRNEHSILTVSSYLTDQEGEQGLSDVCVSLPVIIGRKGIEGNIDLALTDEEREQLRHSADVVREAIPEEVKKM